MSTTGPDLSDRYGAAGARSRRAVVLVSGIIGVLGLAWVVWAAVIQGSPDVQSTLRSFHVVDDHEVDASVAVKARSSDVRAHCLVRAYGTDHSVVGELNFVATHVEGTEVKNVSFRTERGATAVELVGCTTPDQKRPR